MATRRSHILPAALQSVLRQAARVRKKPRSASPRVYRLHLSLLEIEPLIWRRLQVPATISLRQLHDVFQVAMGWTDSHLHEFTVGDQQFGMTEPEVDPPETLRDDRGATLDDIASNGEREFTYDYDFGDGWTHRVVIESVENAGVAARRALCLDGARACPPEDCGGPHAYEELLGALKNPSHKRNKDLVDWIGVDFDSEQFDLDVVNSKLRTLRLSADKRRPAARGAERRN